MSAVSRAVLVLNSGSSSLKAGLFVPDPGTAFAGERAVLTAEAGGIGQGGGSLRVKDEAGKELEAGGHALTTQAEALEAIVATLGKHGDTVPAAIGHRVVHGGPRLLEHTRLTPGVLETLRGAVHFAPLHLPHSIELMEQAARLYRDVPQAACFDTTFHRTMPPTARRLPIPDEYEEAGVRRYGFHGLSYESLIRQLRADSQPLPERIVMAHLGSGSSLCAALRGESVDTTMSFTPDGGIPMATRTGDLDPGVLFFMARQGHLSIDELEQLVNHKSGLAAISGGTGDMQQLAQAMADTTTRDGASAALAFEVFAVAIAKQVAALTVSLAGLDLLVFAGGIGEHSAALRQAVVERLAPFGLRLDEEANRHHASAIHAPASRVPVRVLPAQEDPVIAAHTRGLTERS